MVLDIYSRPREHDWIPVPSVAVEASQEAHTFKFYQMASMLAPSD